MADMTSEGAGSSTGAGIDLSQFYQVFFEEAGENLQNMEQQLLELDVSAAAWTLRATMNGPPARRSSVGLTVGGVRTLVSGVFDDGQTQTLFNDVWTLQWPARTWQQDSGPWSRPPGC